MRHPNCPYTAERCRITSRSYVQPPLIAWSPQFDGKGLPVNSDPNTFIRDYTCLICTGEWREVRRPGRDVETTVTKPARLGEI